MYNNFVQRLKRIKSELLALKTAQPRGLGSASFFSAVSDYSFDAIGGTVIFVVSVEYTASQDTIPYCQCYISNAQYFQPASISWNEASKTLSFYYECYVNNVSLNGIVKVITNGSINNLYTGAL